MNTITTPNSPTKELMKAKNITAKISMWKGPKSSIILLMKKYVETAVIRNTRLRDIFSSNGDGLFFLPGPGVFIFEGAIFFTSISVASLTYPDMISYRKYETDCNA